MASNANVTSARQILGPWKIGGDAATYLPSAPASAFFNGTIADVAVYPKALTSTQVYNHFAE